MTITDDEIKAAFARAREADLSHEEVRDIARRLHQRDHGGSQRLREILVASLIAAVVAASALAVPPVRAALGDLADSFSGYFDGEPGSGDEPGREVVESDSPPAWLSAGGRSGQRLLAEAGGYELYLVREPSGGFGFALDDQVGISDSAQGWRKQFSDHFAVVLGPGPRADSAGIVPLYGVNTPSVDRIEVEYRDGDASVVQPTQGGFVALVDAARQPERLITYSGGETLEAIDLTYIGWEALVSPSR